jgi:Gram-negative bacterial TonB protein C-terminal
MSIAAQIGLVSVLLVTPVPQQSAQDYLQLLVGQRLILRHYAGSPSSQVKERDLSGKRGGCDAAIEVATVAFEKSSVRFQLKNIGTPNIPNIQKQTSACTTGLPDEYTLRITDFGLDEPIGHAEASVGYVLQTPEAYLAAYGVMFNPPRSSESESPVDFPQPGLTAPKVLLAIFPYYSETNRKAHIEGMLTIQCVVGTDGLIHNPVVTEGLTAEINKLVLDAVTFWRLEPVRDGNRPVAARLPLKISFRVP